MTAPIAFLRASLQTLAAIGLSYPDRRIPWTADDHRQFNLLGSLLLSGVPVSNEATDLINDVLCRVNRFDAEVTSDNVRTSIAGLWPRLYASAGADRRSQEEFCDLTLPVLWASWFLFDQTERLPTQNTKRQQMVKHALEALADRCLLRLHQLRQAFIDGRLADAAPDLSEQIKAVSLSLARSGPLVVISFQGPHETLTTAHCHLRLVADA